MRTKLFVVVCSLCLVAISSTASGQTAEVFAFEAPDCSSMGNSQWCSEFQTSVLPKVSGIGYVAHWKDLDKSSSSNNTVTYSYSWTELENFFNAYINSSNINWKTACVGGSACKIMMILQPEVDGLGGGNTYTPGYVFSSSYANAIGADQPQDMAACHEFPGSGSLPYSGSPGSGDAVIWNASSCSVVAGTGLTCTGSNLNNTTGFPVVYELPIMTAYQHFLSAFSTNFNSSTGNDKNIGQYIVYVRAGLSVGGENYPVCEEVNPPLGEPSWVANFNVAAGVLVTPTVAQGNAGGYTFLSLNAGKTGSANPTWNQSPGNRMTTDGSVTWANEGVININPNAKAVWPGPEGQSFQPNAFQDNGYLGHWYSGITNQGYVGQMAEYMAGLESTFSWDFATNFGPGQYETYPDADAVLADTWGDDEVGFGMQSLSVEDPVTYAAGVFPTSREDWIANFSYYPAPADVPVHHLQTNIPGNKFLAAGYDFYSVTPGHPVIGDATVNCGTSSSNPADCSWFYGFWTYITNNNYYNGAWASPCTGEGSGSNQCPTDEMIIESSNTHTGGTGIIWSPNYWPDTLVFAVDRNATVLEVQECDLDFAFGVTTTTHVSNESGSGGCASWGLAGPNTAYQTALSSAQ